MSGHATVESLRLGLEALRRSAQDALEGLRDRFMDEQELRIWETTWGQAIGRQYDGLRNHHASKADQAQGRLKETLASLIEQSERLCQQDLAAFVGAGRDRIRQERSYRLVGLIGVVLTLAGVIVALLNCLFLLGTG